MVPEMVAPPKMKRHGKRDPDKTSHVGELAAFSDGVWSERESEDWAIHLGTWASH